MIANVHAGNLTPSSGAKTEGNPNEDANKPPPIATHLCLYCSVNKCEEAIKGYDSPSYGGINVDCGISRPHDPLSISDLPSCSDSVEATSGRHKNPRSPSLKGEGG